MRKSRNIVRRSSIIFLLAALCIAGCGRSLPDRAPVSGKITWQGKPVAQGRVTFYPTEGRPAMSEIRPDGSYRLTTFDEGDGAILGPHKVTIEATQVVGDPSQPKTFEDELRGRAAPPGAVGVPKVVWLVPEKYSRPETTPVTAEVKPGENTMDLNLP